MADKLTGNEGNSQAASSQSLGSSSAAAAPQRENTGAGSAEGGQGHAADSRRDSESAHGPRHTRFSRRHKLKRLRPGLRSSSRMRGRSHDGAEHAASGGSTAQNNSDNSSYQSNQGREESQSRNNDSRRAQLSLQDVLGDPLKGRARNADPKLRAQLVGSIVIRFTNSGQRYLFDWTTDELKLGPTESENADCVISISEINLLKIASGELNPQIAMLSDKINVKGRLSLAIYWFNLIVRNLEQAELRASA